jgi:hypothetical protein
MDSQLIHKARTLLVDSETVAVIATVGADGSPQLTVSKHLELLDDGRLLHLELLESSETSRNLLRALWFDKQVAVMLHGTNGQSLVLQGKPVKAHISGPVFRQYYETIRHRLGDAGLAAVWLIEPDDIRDDSYETRRHIEKEQFPFHLHLDQLAKKEEHHNA